MCLYAAALNKGSELLDVLAIIRKVASVAALGAHTESCPGIGSLVRKLVFCKVNLQVLRGACVWVWQPRAPVAIHPASVYSALRRPLISVVAYAHGRHVWWRVVHGLQRCHYMTRVGGHEDPHAPCPILILMLHEQSSCYMFPTRVGTSAG